jgi:hypothetical protein
VQSAGADGAVLSVTPAPPSAVAAPGRPVPPAAGLVMPGARAGVTVPAAADAPGLGAPAHQDPQPLPGTPALAAAADSTTGLGVLVPVTGALLAGSALLVVGAARRARIRRS